MDFQEEFNSGTYSYQIFLATIIPSIVIPFFIMLCCCCPCMCCIKSLFVGNKISNKGLSVIDLTKKRKSTVPINSKFKSLTETDLLNPSVRKNISENTTVNLDKDKIDEIIVVNDTSQSTNKKKSSKKSIASKFCYIFEINQNTTTKNVSEYVNTVLCQQVLPDLVIVLIESPGGSVIEYGLIHSELVRIINAKIKLVVCVDKVAASGGYLAACCADQIVASEFAIIGSIGVIMQCNNFKEILNTIGIKVETFTSGDHKIKYDEYNDNSPERIEFLKEQLKTTHEHFKNTVKKYRKNIDIDNISNGSYWYGNKALELGLIDEISTSENYLMKISNEYHLVTLKIKPKKNKLSFINKLFNNLSTSVDNRLKMLKYL